MDSVDVVVVNSPFANLSPLYEVDPDADVLLIVPSSSQPFAPWGPTKHNGAQSTTASAPASRPGLRIKVSSRYLALSSRVFNSKLSLANSQSTRQSDGRTHFQLVEGFDPKAVSIVMNVLHSRGSKVPKSVNIETLAQIAFFTDRFQLLDVVEVYAERWISNLENKFPEAYNRELILWIYASHVFRHADVFKAVTKTAAAQAPGPIATLGLPIREKIIKHIDDHRQTLVTQALNLVHQTIDDLASEPSTCTTHQCDSLLLGELIKSLHRHRLIWPRPQTPFPNVSFGAVVETASIGLGLQSHHFQEVEPWVVPVQQGKTENGLWVNGRGSAPPTPAASPEPVYKRRALGAHWCAARKAVARLDRLGRLEDGVQGLVLESKMGYQLY